MSNIDRPTILNPVTAHHASKKGDNQSPGICSVTIAAALDLPGEISTLSNQNPPPQRFGPYALPVFDFWYKPLVIARNNFIHKSLSCFAGNTEVGCPHGCLFCSVPETTATKQASRLARYGVQDPDADWGNYALLRLWDEQAFMKSLDEAQNTPESTLNPDGNRAIIFSSTTDPYALIPHPDPELRRKLNEHAAMLMRNALERIRDHSTLNVRILTRSPLFLRDLDLLQSFGERLLVGMSIPTLNNRLARFYEPHAPAPTKRLEALHKAKAAGLHVYVAMAPTYPECDETDLRRTLLAFKELDPWTVFHETINIRAENVARMQQHAARVGFPFRSEVFADRLAWRRYAIDSLVMVQRLAEEIGLGHCLHLWPDPDLLSKPYFIQLCFHQFAQEHPGTTLTRTQKIELKKTYEFQYRHYAEWTHSWWSRISDWPGQPRGRRLVTPAVT